MRRTAIGAVAATLIVLSGCSSTTAHPGKSTNDKIQGWPVADVRQAPDGLFTAIPLPLDAYAESEKQLAVLGAAFDVLDHRCMRSKGYDYPPADAMVFRQPPSTPPNFMRYGEDTDGAAALPRADVGYYHSGRRGDPPSIPAMSSAEQTAQSGDQQGKPGGCGEQAVNQLSAGGGDYENSATTVESLDFQSFQTSLQDPRVKNVIAAWSDCMRGRGYSADSPVSHTVDILAWPHAERIADVDCKSSVGLVRIWSGVESEIQQRLITQNLSKLQQETRRRQLTVRTATSVLTTDG